MCLRSACPRCPVWKTPLTLPCHSRTSNPYTPPKDPWPISSTWPVMAMPSKAIFIRFQSLNKNVYLFTSLLEPPLQTFQSSFRFDWDPCLPWPYLHYRLSCVWEDYGLTLITWWKRIASMISSMLWWTKWEWSCLATSGIMNRAQWSPKSKRWVNISCFQRQKLFLIQFPWMSYRPLTTFWVSTLCRI